MRLSLFWVVWILIYHLFCGFSVAQATGEHQPAEGGYWAAEEAAGKAETSEPGIPLAVGGVHLWTEAAQN